MREIQWVLGGVIFALIYSWAGAGELGEGSTNIKTYDADLN